MCFIEQNNWPCRCFIRDKDTCKAMRNEFHISWSIIKIGKFVESYIGINSRFSRSVPAVPVRHF
jgi:hypothetical protein